MEEEALERDGQCFPTLRIPVQFVLRSAKPLYRICWVKDLAAVCRSTVVHKIGANIDSLLTAMLQFAAFGLQLTRRYG